MEGPGCLCLSSDGSSGTGGHQTLGPRLSPTHSDCSRVAKHAMVLGRGQHVGSNSTLTSQGREFVNPTVQSVPHRDLFNLNLHAWLLEPQPFNKQGSLLKWQHELRLLRDAQPERSMSQSGQFLSDGVRTIRWTSGLHL